jgi:hypothetical protein
LYFSQRMLYGVASGDVIFLSHRESDNVFVIRGLFHRNEKAHRLEIFRVLIKPALIRPAIVAITLAYLFDNGAVVVSGLVEVI